MSTILCKCAASLRIRSSKVASSSVYTYIIPRPQIQMEWITQNIWGTCFFQTGLAVRVLSLWRIFCWREDQDTFCVFWRIWDSQKQSTSHGNCEYLVNLCIFHLFSHVSTIMSTYLFLKDLWSFFLPLLRAGQIVTFLITGETRHWRSGLRISPWLTWALSPSKIYLVLESTQWVRGNMTRSSSLFTVRKASRKIPCKI